MIYNNNLLLSVVVPVYNVERYFAECLNSLVNQTYQNIEIIIVDDGSSDSSSAICDVYAAKDKRIRVIHKKNGGLSDARNIGINEAKGKYLLFVDSDDLLADFNVIQNLASFLKSTNAIITYCPFSVRFHDEIPVVEEEFGAVKYGNLCVLTPNDLLSYTKKLHTFFTAWSFVVLREYITKNKLYFREGIVHEDAEWIPRILYAKEEQKVHIFTKPFYLYRVNPDSITSTFTQYRCDSLYLILSELSERIEVSSKKPGKFLKNCFNRYLFFMCMLFEADCMNGSDFFKKNIRILKRLFKDNYNILSLRNRVLLIFLQVNPKMFFLLRKWVKKIV